MIGLGQIVVSGEGHSSETLHFSLTEHHPHFQAAGATRHELQSSRW